MNTGDIVAVFNKPTGNPSGRAYLLREGLDAYSDAGNIDSFGYNFIMRFLKTPIDDKRISNAFVHFNHVYGEFMQYSDKIPLDSFWWSKIDQDPETVPGAESDIFDWTYPYIVTMVYGKDDNKLLKMFGFTDLFDGNKIRKQMDKVEDYEVRSWNVENGIVTPDVNIEIHGRHGNLKNVPEIVEAELNYFFESGNYQDFLYKPPKINDMNALQIKY